MVSSFGLHHRNERTLRELMRIHPDEHPVSIQLFGHDPEVMRSGAAIAAEAGADLIDINMGCPVRKVRRTGAGVELLADPELALALVAAPREGSGRPVTVKLRSGLRAGDRSGFELAVAPRRGGRGRRRSPSTRARRRAGHKGEPDYALTRELVERARGAGDRLRRAEERRGGAARLPRVGRRRGDDRPRRARQPLGLRGADRPARRAAAPRRRSSPSCSGRSTAPRSTSAASARPATCASSTPGTSSRWSSPAEVAQELQRSAGLTRARELVGLPKSPACPAWRLAIIPRLLAQVRRR